MHRPMLVLLGVLACGCAPDLARIPPAHQDGFADGCASSSFGLTTLVQVDRQRYRDDTEYRAGWLTGRNTCSATRPGPLR